MARKLLPKTVLKRTAETLGVLGAVMFDMQGQAVGEYFMAGVDEHTRQAPMLVAERVLPPLRMSDLAMPSAFYDLDGRCLVFWAIVWRQAAHMVCLVLPAEMDYRHLMPEFSVALAQHE